MAYFTRLNDAVVMGKQKLAERVPEDTETENGKESLFREVKKILQDTSISPIAVEASARLFP